MPDTTTTALDAFLNTFLDRAQAELEAGNLDEAADIVTATLAAILDRLEAPHLALQIIAKAILEQKELN